MGRSAKFQGLQKKPEFVFRLFLIYSQSLKDDILKLFLVDTNTASANFNSIQNQIIGLAANTSRVIFQKFHILFFGGRKRMMHCCVPFLFVVILQ